MYSREEFGLQLKKRIKNNESIIDIANWSYSMYSQYRGEIDKNFRDMLLALGGMGMDPEFERSYEELNQIADKLIVGEDFKL